MDELDPVDDAEFVYRRIHRTFFDKNAPIPVQFPAFRPNVNDSTGLSVFRALFVQPAQTVANIDPAKANEYLVARLLVQDLLRLGLTVAPEPAGDEAPGHAVIPQLSWDAYRADKQKWKPILVELAKLASKDLVHLPA